MEKIHLNHRFVDLIRRNLSSVIEDIRRLENNMRSAKTEIMLVTEGCSFTNSEQCLLL